MESRLYNQHQTYEAAELPKKITYSDYASITITVIIDIFKVIFLWLPVACMEFVSLFKPNKPKNITGHVAVVTGGGNGLGRVICLELARKGCNVAVVDLNSEGIENTVKEINDSKLARAEGFKVDVSDADKVDALRDKVIKAFGKVDILINNAGLIPTVSLCEGSKEDIQRIIDVNLTAHFWTFRAFLPHMKERRSGHLVTISSMLGVLSSGRPISYNATKFGSRGLMLALTEELADEGFDCIKTTCVYPYFIATRKDLYDVAYPRYPPLAPETAARTIVLGIRKNIKHLSVPDYLYVPALFVQIFPYSLTRLIRHYLFDATDFTKKWKATAEHYVNSKVTNKLNSIPVQGNNI